jgi:DNA-directed RNA polymerase subunit beta'
VLIADEIAQGLNRVEELFEVRTPRGQAYLSDINGIVNVWEEGDHYILQVTADRQENVEMKLDGQKPTVVKGQEVSAGDVLATAKRGHNHILAPVAGKIKLTETSIIITPLKQSVYRYEIPGFKQLLVIDGDKVEAGQRLTSGSVNLQELMRLQGVEMTQRYILNEILKIFAAQGQNIADKHLEIIIRQMFSRVLIEEAGDSEFVVGDVISKLAVVEANDALIAKKKQPAQFNQLLLGITKASLSTDSFLSAASFQDTTRVLIGAATSGRIDKLYGLKENVILGRKIPVGTGYSTPETEISAEDIIDEEDIKV